MLKPATSKMGWLEKQVYRKYAVSMIWTYDIIRFLLIFKLLTAFNVNPWIFFFLDMGTVPAYVWGWTRLIRTLGTKTQNLHTILLWSVVTFFASTAPYLYTAWAGRQEIPALIWIVFIGVFTFPVINISRKIYSFMVRLPSGSQSG